MSELRAELKKAMLATKYESRVGLGQRGFSEHHIDALLDTVMPIVEPQDGAVITIRPDGEFAATVTEVCGEDLTDTVCDAIQAVRIGLDPNYGLHKGG